MISYDITSYQVPRYLGTWNDMIPCDSNIEIPSGICVRGVMMWVKFLAEIPPSDGLISTMAVGCTRQHHRASRVSLQMYCTLHIKATEKKGGQGGEGADEWTMFHTMVRGKQVCEAYKM